MNWDKRLSFAVLMIFAMGSLAHGASEISISNVQPGASTPGSLCSESDPDFDHFDYPEEVARCTRNVSLNEKYEVARIYGGIPRDQWPEYEFDHLIPLCAGGSNHIENIWPQPLSEAHDKDVLENDICRGMRAGTLTQKQALAQVKSWFATRILLFSQENNLNILNRSQDL